MVNVYLRIEDRQVLLLSIPFSDIERLSIRPVKWLRFVTFAICGARGDLSAVPNGPPVNYDSISLDNISQAYYYAPEGDYHFVDYNAINDQITSSEQTLRSQNFRSHVMQRDGPVCVFTGIPGDTCDAVHLLSKSKGDEYIAVVVQDRLHLYDPLEPRDLNINSVENGLFLSKNLHSSFADGRSAFLKTPNFALDPTDIPRVEADAMPSSRVTLHHLEPDASRYPIPQCDARIAGTGISPPSTVVLDFVYGVAAYQRWGGGQDIEGVMQRCFSERYASIPIPPAAPRPSDSDSSPESDDLDDDDDEYIPSRQRSGRNHSLNMSDGMHRAMDNVLKLSMLLKGTTPELMGLGFRVEERRPKVAATSGVECKNQEATCDHR